MTCRPGNRPAAGCRIYPVLFLAAMDGSTVKRKGRSPARQSSLGRPLRATLVRAAALIRRSSPARRSRSAMSDVVVRSMPNGHPGRLFRELPAHELFEIADVDVLPGGLRHVDLVKN